MNAKCVMRNAKSHHAGRSLGAVTRIDERTAHFAFRISHFAFVFK